MRLWPMVLLGALLWPAGATAFSTLSGVTLSRSVSPAAPKPGQTVTVTLTVKTGALADPLRGFYLSEPVPDGLTPSAVSATLGGNAVTVLNETTASGAVYTGCTTLRWVLEQPPGFSESVPLPANATLALTYQLSLPSSASGSFSFPGASWVGMIPSQGDSGDHFGYEDQASSLTVAPPAPVLGLNPTSLSFSAQEGDADPGPQAVSVSNSGGGTLPDVTHQVSYGPQANGWLTVSRSGSGNSQSLDNQVALAGLSPNTYAATVKVSGAGVGEMTYNVSLTLTAKPSTTEPTITLTPTAVQVSAEQGGAAPAAEVVQVGNSGAGTLPPVATSVSYLDGADWLTVTSGGSDNSQTLDNQVDPSGLAPGTYTATVAVTASGASNSPQNYVVTLTVTAPTSLPGDAGPSSDLGLPPEGGPDAGGPGLQGATPLQGGCQLSPGAGAPPLTLLLMLLALGLIRRRG